jgi:putative tricarboxylic transport membrane protein
MYIGNVMLLILNLPLVGVWASLARIPYPLMGPGILLFSLIGAFSVRNSFFDVWTALFFGALGFLMDKIKIPSTPMILALILTPLIENAFSQSLSMTGGSPVLLFTRPIALGFLLTGVVMIGLSLAARRKKKLGIGGEDVS